MAAQETAAIADIAQASKLGKPGKRPDAGATAGAFTAELASLTRKPKAAKTEQPAQANHASANAPANEHVPTQKKSGEAKATTKTSSSNTMQAPEGKAKPQSETQSDGTQGLTVAIAATAETPAKSAEALTFVVAAKTQEGQTTAPAKPDGKAPGVVAGPVDTNTKSPTPDLNAPAPGAIPDGATQKTGPKDSKHQAKFEELIQRHQASQDTPAQQPQSQQASTVAQTTAAQTSQSTGTPNTSHRAEATQVQATADASQSQAGMLLRTPEASTSSNSFAAQLDATTTTRAVDQVAWTIARKSEAGDRSFEIRMDPAELGRIDVKMNVSIDGKVTAALAVERPETLDLLSRDSRALEQALKNTGLDVDSGALSFSLRDQTASNGFENVKFTGTSDQDDTPETQSVTTAEQVWLGAPKSLLDIKV
jgi:flagellar hook-length control protein FliK